MASGATVVRSQFVAAIYSGTSWTALTMETISGVRAVSLNGSGRVQVAKAVAVGGVFPMPAIGVVVDNVLSGIQANVYQIGLFQLSSGMADYSGYLGTRVWVGRSGQVVSVSGSWNSGGHASGDFGQPLGYVVNSGAVLFNVCPIIWSGGPLGLGSEVGGY